MRQAYPFLTLFLLLPLFLSGQNMREESRAMSQGNKNAFIFHVEGLEEKELSDVLKDHLKDIRSRRNPKYSRRDREFFVDDATMSELSANTIDIYATIESKSNLNHDVIVWFDMGGVYLNSKDHPEAAGQLEDSWFSHLNDRAYNRAVALELELEELKLKDLNKDFDRLQREQKKLEDAIEDYKQKIKQAEQDLKDNAAAQREMEKVIAEQQTVVETVEKKKKN